MCHVGITAQIVVSLERVSLSVPSPPQGAVKTILGGFQNILSQLDPCYKGLFLLFPFHVRLACVRVRVCVAVVFMLSVV